MTDTSPNCPSSLQAGATNSAIEPPKRDLAHDDSRDGCAALGYGDKSQVAFSLPFESLQAFKLETDGMSSAFRAGLVAWNGARVGLVRIKNFSMRQYPSECERTWSTSPKRARSDAKFDDLVTDAWFTTLAAQLRRFRTEHVDILLVDVGSNSGGNDSGEWTPRLLTAKAVRSARLLMSAAPVAQTYIDEADRGNQNGAGSRFHGGATGESAGEPHVLCSGVGGSCEPALRHVMGVGRAASV